MRAVFTPFRWQSTRSGRDARSRAKISRRRALSGRRTIGRRKQSGNRVPSELAWRNIINRRLRRDRNGDCPPLPRVRHAHRRRYALWPMVIQRSPRKFIPPHNFCKRCRMLTTSSSPHRTLSGSKGMIGARELNAMKRSAYLLNIARGALIDEPALINASKTARSQARRSTLRKKNRSAGKSALEIEKCFYHSAHQRRQWIIVAASNGIILGKI